jgi:hypothetical protein
MYKLIKDSIIGKTNVVFRILDSSYIPMSNDNTDYQTFKKEVLAGAELQDADGNVIDGIAYLEELS